LSATAASAGIAPSIDPSQIARAASTPTSGCSSRRKIAMAGAARSPTYGDHKVSSRAT
jgi:hypothetical protein